jgi:AmiR/NasT family two-component response regulator
MRGLGRYGEGMAEPDGDRASALSERVLRVQARLEESMRHMADSMARLQAQLATLPAIEQAKGVIMAQAGCSPEEAFDLLRRASQRSNIPVRELALAIVARAGDGGPGLFDGQDGRG